MTTYSNDNGECFVLTYKEGLLSAIAHDLKIRVGRWSLTVDSDAKTVEGRFDTSTLEVVSAMKNGREIGGALSAKDSRKIEGNIRSDVLHTRKHPSAVFRSIRFEPQGEGYKIEGKLELHGVTRPMSATVRKDGDRYRTDVRLHQPDYKIKPFKAMMGTLRIKAGVHVELSIPAR